MHRYLLFPLLVLNAPLSQAVEYGSTTLQYARSPYASLQRYSQHLCARTMGRALPSESLPAGQGYIHIACESDGARTGDVFAFYREGRLEINYRLASSEVGTGILVSDTQ